MSHSRPLRFFVPGFVVLTLAFVVSSASAVVVPYTEDFSAGVSGWTDSDNADALGHVSSGGPGDAAYVTTTFDFTGSVADAQIVLFRGQDLNNASGDAFVGNWITAGVSQYSFQVRQDTGEALSFFTRFATSANFPGAAGVGFVPVASGVWTTITIDINSTGPQLIYEGGPSNYNSVFGNLGNLQVGFLVPGSLAGDTETFNFGLTNVSVIPEPASLILMGLGSLAMFRRSKRR